MSTSIVTYPVPAVVTPPVLRAAAAIAMAAAVMALAAFWILVGAPALSLAASGSIAGPRDPLAGLFWYGP